MVTRLALIERARLLLAVLAFAMGLAGVAPAMAGILSAAAATGPSDWCAVSSHGIPDAADAAPSGPARSDTHDHAQCSQCAWSTTPFAPTSAVPVVLLLTAQAELPWHADVPSVESGQSIAHARDPPALP